MKLRRAMPSDLAYIHRLEHDPANAPFIFPWPSRRHREAMKDGDCLHLIAESGGHRVGFVFLRGLKDPEQSIEFKRIVIESKGAGHGRQALHLIQELAFRRLSARCLWLDVKEFNARARKLYESEGFVKEGELRERVRRNGRYYSLIVMSKLRREYRPRDDSLERGGLAKLARAFVEEKRWCRRIRRLKAEKVWPGILGVYRVEIEPAQSGVDRNLWVVVGDLPPAYLVMDDAPNAKGALEGYVYEMSRWIRAVKSGRSVDKLIPVSHQNSGRLVTPKPAFANMLAGRLDFIKRELIPHCP